ncbi:SDR family NAD(P)-dependent oxidoreductase [Terribacillus saccharophilus]|uniref:SDR family NAD(P)-dependent oxidoreductase n=1 Tax=Terribacillus saccharophilus TaxID=361277 RepID=UPI001595802B|nr:SDR family NAD(P)-dependent oxidoreductase [Terribacillus saccharophilus]
MNNINKSALAIIAGKNLNLLEIISNEFADQGYDISLVYSTNHRKANNIKQQITKKRKRCLIIEGDFKNKDFYKESIETTILNLGSLDMIVNGISVHIENSINKGFISLKKFKEDYYQPSIAYSKYAASIFDPKITPIVNISPNWDKIKERDKFNNDNN